MRAGEHRELGAWMLPGEQLQQLVHNSTFWRVVRIQVHHDAQVIIRDVCHLLPETVGRDVHHAAEPGAFRLRRQLRTVGSEQRRWTT